MSKYTKVQYEEVAKVIYQLRRWDAHNVRGVQVVPIAAIIDSFVEVFQANNERFDKTKFLRAVTDGQT